MPMDSSVLRYLNRLSDYLFTAARMAALFEGEEEVVYQKRNMSSDVVNSNQKGKRVNNLNLLHLIVTFAILFWIQFRIR